MQSSYYARSRIPGSISLRHKRVLLSWVFGVSVLFVSCCREICCYIYFLVKPKQCFAAQKTSSVTTNMQCFLCFVIWNTNVINFCHYNSCCIWVPFKSFTLLHLMRKCTAEYFSVKFYHVKCYTDKCWISLCNLELHILTVSGLQVEDYISFRMKIMPYIFETIQ